MGRRIDHRSGHAVRRFVPDGRYHRFSLPDRFRLRADDAVQIADFFLLRTGHSMEKFAVGNLGIWLSVLCCTASSCSSIGGSAVRCPRCMSTIALCLVVNKLKKKAVPDKRSSRCERPPLIEVPRQKRRLSYKINEGGDVRAKQPTRLKRVSPEGSACGECDVRGKPCSA